MHIVRSLKIRGLLVTKIFEYLVSQVVMVKEHSFTVDGNFISFSYYGK